MKNSIAMIVTVIGITATATSAMAAEPNYIPWTFDDFDSNCEVIETAEVQQPVEVSVLAIESTGEEEFGELGW